VIKSQALGQFAEQRKTAAQQHRDGGNGHVIDEVGPQEFLNGSATVDVQAKMAILMNFFEHFLRRSLQEPGFILQVFRYLPEAAAQHIHGFGIRPLAPETAHDFKSSAAHHDGVNFLHERIEPHVNVIGIGYGFEPVEFAVLSGDKTVEASGDEYHVLFRHRCSSKRVYKFVLENDNAALKWMHVLWRLIYLTACGVGSGRLNWLQRPLLRLVQQPNC
jgi:hypothetical protein